MRGLCKDCKWAKRDWLFFFCNGRWTFAKCSQPQIGPKSQQPNPVTGEIPEAELHFCSTNRMWSGDCGESGRFWEARS